MKKKAGFSSSTIEAFALVMLILSGICGGLLGMARGVNVLSSNDSAVVLIGLFVWMSLGSGIAMLIALPAYAILKGFARIVAWYEAVPPGCVHIAQADAPPSAPGNPQPTPYPPQHPQYRPIMQSPEAAGNVPQPVFVYAQPPAPAAEPYKRPEPQAPAPAPVPTAVPYKRPEPQVAVTPLAELLYKQKQPVVPAQSAATEDPAPADLLDEQEPSDTLQDDQDLPW